MTKLHYRSERREPSFGPRSVSGSAGRGRATGIRRSPARVKARSAVSAGEPGEPAGGRPWWDRRVLGGQRDRVRRRVRCERAVMVIRSKGRIWHRRLPGCSSSGTSDQDPGKPLSGLSILVLLGFTRFAGGGLKSGEHTPERATVSSANREAHGSQDIWGMWSDPVTDESVEQRRHEAREQRAARRAPR